MEKRHTLHRNKIESKVVVRFQQIEILLEANIAIADFFSKGQCNILFISNAWL